MTDRVTVITKISDLLDNKCGPCEKRLDREKLGNGRGFASIDRYCYKECPIGLELQQLGKQLGREKKGE